MSTLTDEVRAIALEDSPDDWEGPWHHLASRPPRRMSELEYTSRLWGYVYGLAFGIARSGGADETEDATAARAFEAAVEVFNDPHLHDLELVRMASADKADLSEETHQALEGALDKLEAEAGI